MSKTSQQLVGSSHLYLATQVARYTQLLTISLRADLWHCANSASCFRSFLRTNMSVKWLPIYHKYHNIPGSYNIMIWYDMIYIYIKLRWMNQNPQIFTSPRISPGFFGIPRKPGGPGEPRPRMASPLGATTSRSSPWAWTVTQATGWGPRGAMEAMKDGSRVKDGIKWATFIQSYDQLSEYLQISGSVWSVS
jgi:hypothetical protein